MGMKGRRESRVLALWCPDWAAVAAAAVADVPATRPVVVLYANRVVACSAVARAAGVRRGLRRREAQARCPDLFVAQADSDRDARLFEPVVAAVDATVPGVEVLRPGLLVLAARGAARFFGSEEAAAERLVDAVAAAGAECRVGIADELFTAVLAARRAALVPPGAGAEFLAPLPVGELAVEPSLAAPERADLVDLLHRLGLRRIGDFAALTPAEVASRFGADAIRAHRCARAEPERAPSARPPAPDLTVEYRCDPPIDRVDAAAFAGRLLATRLHERLSAASVACTRLSIVAETVAGETLSRIWRCAEPITPEEAADRVRWQLDGWLTQRALSGPREPGEPEFGTVYGRGADDRGDSYSAGSHCGSSPSGEFHTGSAEPAAPPGRDGAAVPSEKPGRRTGSGAADRSAPPDRPGRSGKPVGPDRAGPGAADRSGFPAGAGREGGPERLERLGSGAAGRDAFSGGVSRGSGSEREGSGAVGWSAPSAGSGRRGGPDQVSSGAAGRGAIPAEPGRGGGAARPGRASSGVTGWTVLPGEPGRGGRPARAGRASSGAGPGRSGVAPTAPITVLRLEPVEVVSSGALQLGLWGSTGEGDERARRALVRVQGLLGGEAVRIGVLSGGRGPAERITLVAVGDEQVPAADPALPWPGRLPEPAPAVILANHPDVVLEAADGTPVWITDRGLFTAEPARLHWGRRQLEVTGWAGPWLLDERWWAADGPGRTVRTQVLLDTDFRALLLFGYDRAWHVEGLYE